MAKVELGLEITELRLGLPGTDKVTTERKRKSVSSDVSEGVEDESETGNRKAAPVVGWPPVCSYRRKNSSGEKDVLGFENSKMYVKVSMDGAPFLRKIDLGMYKGYSDLAVALEKLFGCFGMDKALKDEDSSEYVPIYEDKDGDWMLAGDVPWEMFTESCKRLRIMKRSDAKGFGVQLRDFLKENSKGK